MVKKKTIHIRFPQEIIKKLDLEAKKRVCKTRSELIRQLLREYIEEQND